MHQYKITLSTGNSIKVEKNCKVVQFDKAHIFKMVYIKTDNFKN